MGRIFMISACVLGLAACDPEYASNTNELAYTQDVRTGLCFAWYGSTYRKNLTFSVVPCSSEVMAMVVRTPAAR